MPPAGLEVEIPLLTLCKDVPRCGTLARESVSVPVSRAVVDTTEVPERALPLS